MSDLTDSPFDRAAELGLEVIVERPDVLMLDIDEPEQDVEVLEDVLGRIEKIPTMPPIMRGPVTVSASGKGRHVYLTTPGALSRTERTLLQAVLGSDRSREALGFARIMNATYPASVMFETKAEAERVRAWLATLPPAPREPGEEDPTC